MNNSFNSTNNSDKSINNYDNDNKNITYCNITYISRNLTFEVKAKYFDPDLIAVIMKTFACDFHWQVPRSMFKEKWKI